MTIKPMPGNQPHTNDMAAAFAIDDEGTKTVTTHPNFEEEEEEAARLGDFA